MRNFASKSEKKALYRYQVNNDRKEKLADLFNSLMDKIDKAIELVKPKDDGNVKS